ncbi:SOS response-associated peptidase [Candidatus Nitrospira salsa]
MCGRYVRLEKIEDLLLILNAKLTFKVASSYNIAPSQMVACVRNAPENEHRECTLLKWGLVPSWAKDVSIRNKMVNARSETVAEKPSFRSAFKRRRCLIVAHGYYEWKREGKRKQPYYIRFKDQRSFAFAGLWERNDKATKEPIESCTIVTTGPNAFMESIHHRMPVILEPSYYDRWLDSTVSDPITLNPVLGPYRNNDEMEAYPVSTMVNSPTNNRVECIQPLT